MAPRKTAAAAQKATSKPKGLSTDLLRGVVEDLDMIEQTAQGFGRFVSAQIEIEDEDSGGRVVATYDGREWRLEVTT